MANHLRTLDEILWGFRDKGYEAGALLPPAPAEEHPSFTLLVKPGESGLLTDPVSMVATAEGFREFLAHLGRCTE